MSVTRFLIYHAPMLTKFRRAVLQENLEGGNFSISTKHDIHEDDTKFIVKKDGSDEEKEDGNAKYQMSGPTLVAKYEVGIIQGWKYDFIVKWKMS